MANLTALIAYLNALKISYLPKTKAKRNVLWAVLLTTGAGVMYKLISPSGKRGQNSDLIITSRKKENSKPKVGVDFVFYERLKKILKIIFPSWRSQESLHLAILTLLLLARTILSIQVADVTGKNAQYLVQKRWKQTIWGIVWFAAIGIPASCVNSLLRYETNILSLKFRRRLSETIHKEYLSGVNFYKASHLGGVNRIDNA
jgi:ABC-type uncharacterized transport system fused permease/ATPase subunit